MKISDIDCNRGLHLGEVLKHRLPPYYSFVGQLFRSLFFLLVMYIIMLSAARRDSLSVALFATCTRAFARSPLVPRSRLRHREGDAGAR